MDHDKLKILKRVESGEISAEQALAMLGDRKKPGRKPKAKTPKKPNGRPLNLKQREKILAYWVLYHDKMPKQRLKEKLSDMLHVDISVIEKRIAEINRVARDPNILILRDDEGRVLACTKAEFRRAQIRARRMSSNVVNLLNYRQSQD